MQSQSISKTCLPKYFQSKRFVLFFYSSLNTGRGVLVGYQSKCCSVYISRSSLVGNIVLLKTTKRTLKNENHQQATPEVAFVKWDETKHMETKKKQWKMQTKYGHKANANKKWTNKKATTTEENIYFCSNIYPMLMSRLVVRFFCNIFMWITATSPFLRLNIHMRWEWILFAAFISLSFTRQLWFVDGLSVFCVSHRTNSERVLRDRSASRHHQHIHFISLHQSRASRPCNLSSCMRCVYIFWIDSLFTFVKKNVPAHTARIM